jgi:hypothetical protein
MGDDAVLSHHWKLVGNGSRAGRGGKWPNAAVAWWCWRVSSLVLQSSDFGYLRHRHLVSIIAPTQYCFHLPLSPTTSTRDISILNMDAAIDLSDVSKALDLANIRFQLMYCTHHLRDYN